MPAGRVVIVIAEGRGIIVAASEWMPRLWLGCSKLAQMNPHPVGLWIATGITDMRRGMSGL